MPDQTQRSPGRAILAYLVHLFTASGVVFGFLAIEEIIRGDFRTAFLWMGAALFVDMVDGTLARAAQVSLQTPNFDGALLDNMTDYFNYVIIPAFFLYQGNILPTNLKLAGAAAVCLTSAYQFCQKDAKTEDHYFKGFPSYWNILVIYLLVLDLSTFVNFAIVAVLCVLVFVPIKYIYPSRTELLKRTNITLTVVWAVLIVAAILQYPDANPWLVRASLAYVAYYFAVSLWVTLGPTGSGTARGTPASP